LKKQVLPGNEYSTANTRFVPPMKGIYFVDLVKKFPEHSLHLQAAVRLTSSYEVTVSDGVIASLIGKHRFRKCQILKSKKKQDI
jgi:hypothetical protein